MATSPDEFQVDLVAVDAKIWSGKARMLRATTTEGDIGVLAGHAPLLGQLIDDSLIQITTADGEHAFRVQGAYISVTDDGVSLPVEAAEPVKLETATPGI